jgi:hypothetical protein
MSTFFDFHDLWLDNREHAKTASPKNKHDSANIPQTFQEQSDTQEAAFIDDDTNDRMLQEDSKNETEKAAETTKVASLEPELRMQVHPDNETIYPDGCESAQEIPVHIPTHHHPLEQRQNEHAEARMMEAMGIHATPEEIQLQREAEEYYKQEHLKREERRKKEQSQVNHHHHRGGGGSEVQGGSGPHPRHNLRNHSSHRRPRKHDEGDEFSCVVM